MRIHLLEDVKHRGRRGDTVDVPDGVAIDLEKHGLAAFVPTEPEAAVDQGEAEGSGDDPQADEHSHAPKAKAKKAK
jgi:ribosomal protein L9